MDLTDTARPPPLADTGPSREEIVGACAQLEPESISMLSDLVRHGSLLGEEAPAQALMARSFRDLGLEVIEFCVDESRIRAHPGYSPSIVSYEGRPNVVGIHRPGDPVRGKSLIFNGHIDVVPVGAGVLWSRPPFEPHVEGDRLYGRGAADMKAGLVAYTMAFKALQRLGWEPAAPVYLQSVVEEECTGNGALACLVEGYKADAVVITEPTPGIMQSQMGVMWLSIDVLGVPVHASVAHTGVGAIEFARYLVDRLRELEARWNRPENRHPLYCDHQHPVNFNLGRLAGGEWASSVSTHCRADLRLGFYPGTKPAQVRAEVEALLAAAHAEHPARASVRYDITYRGFQAEGLVVDLRQPAMATLIDCHRQIAGSDPALMRFTGTTDVKFFHLYGDMPATCYGPNGGNIHGIDEWVSLAALREVTAVLALFISRWCGLNRICESAPGRSPSPPPPSKRTPSR
jgi:acetylornithine deacetylase